MNRRDFFRGTPAVAAVAVGAAAAVKAAADLPRPAVDKTYMLENTFEPRMEHVLTTPSPVVQMLQYRDQLIVACQNGEVLAISHDAFFSSRRMHETG